MVFFTSLLVLVATVILQFVLRPKEIRRALATAGGGARRGH
jgi:hypothetical protein